MQSRRPPRNRRLACRHRLSNCLRRDNRYPTDPPRRPVRGSPSDLEALGSALHSRRGPRNTRIVTLPVHSQEWSKTQGASDNEESQVMAPDSCLRHESLNFHAALKFPAKRPALCAVKSRQNEQLDQGEYHYGRTFPPSTRTWPIPLRTLR